ncbi:hypothetical protein IT072_07760 [Leifsonia sp. ZF2019]|uniref:hypothetical protein n=1 Tax=Leifsonia sp. ZF2019 TaxID=2781978 RepID=UPI001CBDAA80|nr:hypothetical protein [Leifsonia sp. ZF2019]UAJ80891.1 hypothetical protein IT072_07760 [Leifsonia sp. ZF2019]
MHFPTYRRIAATGSAVLAGTALALGSGIPANAWTQAASDEFVTPGESRSFEGPDGNSTVLSLGEPVIVTAEDIAHDSGLSLLAKAELTAAAAYAGVSSNHWSQFVTGAAYTQTQNGTFYYNGSRVWVSESYAGYRGSHACFTNYVVWPWSISNVAKSEWGGTSSRSMNCTWNVGQPGYLTTSWGMTATVYSNGTISGSGASRG